MTISSHTVYLALGSNQGSPRENIERMIALLSEKVGAVISISSFIETTPEGFLSEYNFVNAAVEVQTTLSPRELLVRTQDIEKEMGRTSKSRNGTYSDRVSDIDIIFYDDQVIEESGLEIPHPRFRERGFVLIPMAQIAPLILDPVSGRSIQELLDLYQRGRRSGLEA